MGHRTKMTEIENSIFKLLVTKRDYWRWRDWTFSSILLPLAVELKIVNSHTRFHNRAKTINIGDCQNETLKNKNTRKWHQKWTAKAQQPALWSKGTSYVNIWGPKLSISKLDVPYFSTIRSSVLDFWYFNYSVIIDL